MTFTEFAKHVGCPDAMVEKLDHIMVLQRIDKLAEREEALRKHLAVLSREFAKVHKDNARLRAEAASMASMAIDALRTHVS